MKISATSLWRRRSDPEHRDEMVVHVMGTCAGYAYSDGQTVPMIAARLGLEDNTVG